LDLKTFDPGSIILHNGSSRIFADPLRSPLRVFSTFTSGVAGLGDLLRLYKLRKSLVGADANQLLDQKDRPSSEALRERGFGAGVLNKFLFPFYRGIFLEPSLHTSIGMFDFTFKMFAEGDAAIPAKGMGAIPAQLAGRIGREHIRCGQTVQAIEGKTLRMADGSSMQADKILMAVDCRSSLLKPYPSTSTSDQAGSTTCVYFASPKAPYSQKLIALKSAPQGIVNNLAVLNSVAPAYAPEGQHLISVSVREPQAIDDPALCELIRQELSPWYGTDVLGWQHVATYRIPHALPGQRKVKSSIPERDFQLSEGLYVAGDYLLNGSIHAAMLSGRLAAKAILS
jgi:phytoene dehydrogenase-like protein